MKYFFTATFRYRATIPTAADGTRNTALAASACAAPRRYGCFNRRLVGSGYPAADAGFLASSALAGLASSADLSFSFGLVPPLKSVAYQPVPLS